MKNKRQEIIKQELLKNKFLKVKDLSDLLDVSDMTVRRDLDELAKDNVIDRLHGGARIKNHNEFHEISHNKKMNINIDLKIQIAEKIANEINDHDIVFLGAGTTIELTHTYLENKSIKVVTNSLPLFLKLKDHPNKEVILIGGKFRNKTNSFVGSIANNYLSSLRMHKTFIGVNGLKNNSIYNYNEDEGITQQIILNRSNQRYIIADNSKFDQTDFFEFYDLSEVDFLITDNELDTIKKNRYRKFVKIL